MPIDNIAIHCAIIEMPCWRFLTRIDGDTLGCISAIDGHYFLYIQHGDSEILFRLNFEAKLFFAPKHVMSIASDLAEPKIYAAHAASCGYAICG